MIKLPPKDEFKAKALAALAAGELQCQQQGFEADPERCLYTGPCVIGATLSIEDRQILDDYGNSTGDGLSISGAIQTEDLVEAPDWISIADLERLQGLHDFAKVDDLRVALEAL